MKYLQFFEKRDQSELNKINIKFKNFVNRYYNKEVNNFLDEKEDEIVELEELYKDLKKQEKELQNKRRSLRNEINNKFDLIKQKSQGFQKNYTKKEYKVGDEFRIPYKELFDVRNYHPENQIHNIDNILNEFREKMYQIRKEIKKLIGSNEMSYLIKTLYKIHDYDFKIIEIRGSKITIQGLNSGLKKTYTRETINKISYLYRIINHQELTNKVLKKINEGKWDHNFDKSLLSRHYNRTVNKELDDLKSEVEELYDEHDEISNEIQRLKDKLKNVVTTINSKKNNMVEITQKFKKNINVDVKVGDEIIFNGYENGDDYNYYMSLSKIIGQEDSWWLYNALHYGIGSYNFKIIKITDKTIIISNLYNPEFKRYSMKNFKKIMFLNRVANQKNMSIKALKKINNFNDNN